MRAKLAYLAMLTAALVGLAVLLIVRSGQISPAVDTILGGLLGALGLGAHAVFGDKSPPTQPAEPAKVNS